MRTTLNIDVDVLAAAKEIAQRERKTAGQSVSELIRPNRPVLPRQPGKAPAGCYAAGDAEVAHCAAQTKGIIPDWERQAAFSHN